MPPSDAQTNSHRPIAPPAWPLLGHLPDFLRDRLAFLRKCSTEYGDVVPLRIGEPTYLINNADDVRHVFIGNAENYDKTPRMTSRRGKWLSGEGLLTSFGDDHKRRRRMLQPFFHRRAIEQFAELVVRMTDREIESWKGKDEIDVAESMMRLSQSIIVRAVMGTDFEDHENRFANAVSTRRKFIEYVFRSLVPYAEFHPTPLRWRYRQAIQLIDAAIFKRIEEVRDHGPIAPESAKDFITLFTWAKDDKGEAMSDAEIRDEALTLLITGYETVGVGLAWTLLLLAQHPECAQAIRDEVRSVVGTRNPTAADFDQLRTIGNVYAESLRLYPPTWITVRIARAEDRLPSGATIPAGAKLYLSEYAMHHNPRYWADPERFDPTRFVAAEKGSRPTLAYFPFGAGPRVCIGEPLARLESILVLARLAQRVKLELTPGQIIEPDPRIILTPRDGIRMKAMRIDFD